MGGIFADQGKADGIEVEIGDFFEQAASFFHIPRPSLRQGQLIADIYVVGVVGVPTTVCRTADAF